MRKVMMPQLMNPLTSIAAKIGMELSLGIQATTMKISRSSLKGFFP